MMRDRADRRTVGTEGTGRDKGRRSRIVGSGGLLAAAAVTILLIGCAGAGHEAGRGTDAGTVGTEQIAAEASAAEQPAVEPSSAEQPAMEPSAVEEAGGQLLFEGQDMEGSRVTSEILAQSDLTMVNVWATYCNPCLREMPGLGELAGEYAQEDFQIIGIISDVQEGADQRMLDMAAELIEKTGADYPHLLLNESLYRGLLKDVTAVPTTFFINKDGEILETVVGSMEKSDWKEKVDGFLEK